MKTRVSRLVGCGCLGGIVGMIGRQIGMVWWETVIICVLLVVAVSCLTEEKK